MTSLDRIAEWEQHLNKMEPYQALRMLSTVIANRIAAGQLREAGALMHIQTRIQRAVDEFKSGYKED